MQLCARFLKIIKFYGFDWILNLISKDLSWTYDPSLQDGAQEVMSVQLYCRFVERFKEKLDNSLKSSVIGEAQSGRGFTYSRICLLH